MGVEERRSVLKKALKEWETAFAVLNERRPNKDDIEKASDKIKGYYREYRQLGRSNSENTDVEKTPKNDKRNHETGNVWGSHLNKKQKKEKSEESKKESNGIIPTYGLKKREFNKVLPNSARKRTNLSKIKAANTTVVEQEPTEDDSITFDLPSSCKLVTKTDKLKSANFLSGSPNILTMKKPKPSLDSSWLKRCQTTLTTETSELDSAAGNNEEKFRNFEDETVHHNATPSRTKLNSNRKSGNKDDKIENRNEESEYRNEQNEYRNRQIENKNVQSEDRNGQSEDRNGQSENGNLLCENRDGKNENISGKVENRNGHCEGNRQLNLEGLSLSYSIENSYNKKNDSVGFRMSGQKREREELALEEQTRSENQSKKRKIASVQNLQINEDTPVRGSYESMLNKLDTELSFNTKSQIEKDDNVDKNEESTDEEKPVKKKKKLVVPPAPSRSASSLNENFVKINLRKKVYTRAPSKMTGPAYKRQQWKIKMGKASGKSISRGSGGGWRKPGVCFKCGQEGHWAKFCKGKRLPVKPSVDEEEIKAEDLAESPFPTLEEAAIAATGIKYPKGEVTFNFLNAPAPPPDEETPVVRSAIEPIFKLNEDGKPIDTPKEVYKALREMGFDSFRGGQEKAIMRILSGLSTLVVLSTGAGKSLCYQLPAYMYAQRSNCITLVISPLVSLMEDQVIGLPGCLQGARLHSNLSKSQREKVVNEITSGKVQVLLISPEAVVGGGGGAGCLPPLHKLPPIAFACIDEAHCVSEWSHNFRPSYLMVCKVIRERFGVKCLLGLTATATMSTAMSVVSHLGIDEDAVVRGRSVPNNLKLSVSKDENREKALVELLQGDRFNNLDSIIVYCIRREQTEKVASILRTCLPEGKRKNESEPVEIPEKMENKETKEIQEEVEEDVTEHGKRKRKGKGKKKAEKKVKKPKRPTYKTTIKPDERPDINSAEAYHAGMSACQRRKVQNAFMSGSIRIVVATVAFGMGLDKSDVRAIIHYNMPKSFESYVQEIGRAGRDGKPAHCHLFLDSEGRDLSELRRHTYANTLDRFTLKKLCRKVFLPCRCKEKAAARQAAKEAQAFEDDDEDYMMIPDDVLSQKVKSDQTDDVLQNPMEDQLPNLIKNKTPNQVPNLTPNHTTSLTTTENPVKELEVTGELKAYTSNILLQDSKQTSSKEESETPSVEVRCERKNPRFERLCPGHERAIPIEQTVENLDIKEEGISTLLCHLELHPQQWVSNLPPALATCTINCYGGPQQMQRMAHKCPALAAAIALHQQKTGKSLRNKNSLEFPVVEVASEMNWQSGMVKKELKNLQWNGKMKSGVMVELSDLGFHFRSPGDLTDKELDGVVDFLYSKVRSQEKRELFQLKSVYKALNSVSCDYFWMCSADVDEETSDELKTILREYFDKKSLVQWLEDDEIEFDDSIIASASTVRASVRNFLSLHHDRDFTGRAIARIFHGIASPCYPAQVWGRDRRYWRCHLDFDFNLLIKIATEVVLQMR